MKWSANVFSRWLGRYKITGWGRMLKSIHVACNNLSWTDKMRQNWQRARFSVDKWNQIRSKKNDIWKGRKPRVSGTGKDLIISDQSGILSLKRKNQSVFSIVPWLGSQAWTSQSGFPWSGLQHCQLGMIWVIVGCFSFPDL